MFKDFKTGLDLMPELFEPEECAEKSESVSEAPPMEPKPTEEPEKV